MFFQTTSPEPSALTAAMWFFGYPPLVKTCVPSVTMEDTHSVVAPLNSQSFFAVVRVEARDEIAPHQDQLIAPSDLGNDGRDVVGLLGTVNLPDNFAGFPVEPADRAAGLVVGGDDDEVLVDGR